MNLESRLEISPDVVAREVGEETMLLDLASGTYFGLDAVGGRVWQALDAGASLTEACDRIEGDFEVTRVQLEADVLALIGQIVEQGLATVA